MKKGIHRFLLFVGLMLVFVLFDLHCPIKMIFHVPCPACGMTRAWMSLIHFDIERAFEYHPLFLLGPVIVLLVCFDDIQFRAKDAVCILIGIAFALVYAMGMF